MSSCFSGKARGPGRIRGTVCALCLLLVSGWLPAAEPEWGTLRGRFVYEGPVPEPEKLVLNKDIEYCAPRKPRSEKLLVNKENKGIANVVIYLYLGRKAPPPPIHPGYQTTARQEVLIDNFDCRFEPHITLLRTSQKLKITNNDDVAHNTAAFLRRNNPFNAVTPAGKTVFKSLSQGERLPAQISCSIHPWMQGWLLVQTHPYMTITDSNGDFEIPRLPAGEWTFQFWHESAGYLTQVIRKNRKTEWKRGRVDLKIPAGKLDLETLKVPAELFNR